MLLGPRLTGFGAGGAVCTLLTDGLGTAIGSMTSGGGLAAGFDGVTSQSAAAGSYSGATSGQLGKDWGAGVTYRICKYEFWTPNDTTIDGGAGTTTITSLDLHGSTDNFSASDVTLAAPANVTSDANGTLVTIEADITDLTAYRYHKIFFAHDGGAETHIAEVRFWALIG